MVVALRARARIRPGERVDVQVLLAPSGPAQSSLEAPLGTEARGRALQPCLLAVPPPLRRDLRRSLCVAGRADPGAGGQQRNPPAPRLSRRCATRARQRGISTRAYALLARCERRRAHRRHRCRSIAGPDGDRRPLDAAGAHRPLRALRVLLLRRTGLHELPVGRAARGDRVPGDISYRRVAGRRLALSLARLSLPVAGRRGKAPFRRCDMARPDRARLSLLDAAAAHAARLACSAAAPLAAGRRHRRHAGLRAGSRLSHLSAPASARLRRVLRAPPPGADSADRQLQLLQSPEHADLRFPVRRRGVATLVSGTARNQGAEARTRSRTRNHDDRNAASTSSRADRSQSDCTGVCTHGPARSERRLRNGVAADDRQQLWPVFLP